MDKKTVLPEIDIDYALYMLLELLSIPSPTGFTDKIVHFTCEKLDALSIHYEITRRGAIRAQLKGKVDGPDRAIVAHLDTIGAMVKGLKDNGRTELVPVGTWSSRFAEGAKATLFTDNRSFRGRILPNKASGHAFNEEVDSQPISWENVEFRIDEPLHSRQDLIDLGVDVGNFVAVDPSPEISDSGFINSRHLDDKAGVAIMLALAKAVVDNDIVLPVDCHLLFTISEEVGSGASAVLHQDVAEMITIDTGPSAPGQTTDEYGVTICMQDSSGPFDYHLTQRLIRLCKEHNITYKRDIFKYYKCDSASALEAGNDIRTALVCFGTDATHGYERCHVRSLTSLGKLLFQYILHDPLFERDKQELGPLEGFPNLTAIEN